MDHTKNIAYKGRKRSRIGRTYTVLKFGMFQKLRGGPCEWKIVNGKDRPKMRLHGHIGAGCTGICSYGQEFVCHS